MSQSQWREPPTPDPGMVRAARAHLTAQYARGVERLLWETHKHPLADVPAVEAVIRAVSRGDREVDGKDIAAAMVLMQAARLDVDRLEADLLDRARDVGLAWEAIAAVLDLPGAASAQRRYQWLQERTAEPVAEQERPHLSSAENARHGAELAGRRAHTAAERATEAGQRRRELRDAPPGRGSQPAAAGGARPAAGKAGSTVRGKAGAAGKVQPGGTAGGGGRAGSGSPNLAGWQAEARNAEARLRSAEARERAAMSFLRTAAGYERAAAAAETRAPGDEAASRQAAEQRAAAAVYRRLAERMQSSLEEDG